MKPNFKLEKFIINFASSKTIVLANRGRGGNELNEFNKVE